MNADQNLLDKIQNVQVSSQTLPERVADQINDLIIRQHLKDGERIPNEFELGNQLNVSRGTIREAIKILVARNVLEIRRGKGTFVAKHTGEIEDPFGFAYMDEPSRLTRELYDVRMLIEPWNAEEAARKRTEENLRDMKAVMEEIEDNIRSEEGISKYMTKQDIQFHVMIAKSTQNRVMQKILPVVIYGIYTFLSNHNRRNRVEETIATHRKIYDAIEAQDPAAAREAMIEHLNLNLAAVPDLDTEAQESLP